MTTELLITQRMSGQTVAMDSLSSLTELEPYLEKNMWLSLNDWKLEIDVNENRMAFNKQQSQTPLLNLIGMSHKQITSLFLVWLGNVSQVGSEHGLFACSKIQMLFRFVISTYSTRLTHRLLASTTTECNAFHSNTFFPTKQCCCYCVIVDATVRGIA